MLSRADGQRLARADRVRAVRNLKQVGVRMVIGVGALEPPGAGPQVRVAPGRDRVALLVSRDHGTVNAPRVRPTRVSLHLGGNKAVRPYALRGKAGYGRKGRRDEKDDEPPLVAPLHLRQRERAIAGREHLVVEALHEGVDLVRAAPAQGAKDELARLLLLERGMQLVADAPPGESSQAPRRHHAVAAQIAREERAGLAVDQRAVKVKDGHAVNALVHVGACSHAASPRCSPYDTARSAFYRKRIGRIVVPMLFWSLLLPILFFLYFNYVSPDTRNPQLSVADYTPLTLIRKLYTFIFNFNFDTVPFWYLYMLIGLYLLMPVLSPWLAKASKGDLELVLKIWGVSLVLPYVKMFAPLAGYTGNWGNMNILGVCDWNDYGTFYYFSGFVGYLILAYYLRRYPLDWSWRKMLMITVPMFLVGYVITAYGYVMTQNYFPGNYAYLEIVWYFAGINVFMMTFPVFVIVQKLNARNRLWLSRLASYTFGIYLCHFIFVFMCFDLYDVDGLPYLIRIICTALTSFVLSAVVVALMSSWKLTARFVR